MSSLFEPDGSRWLPTDYARGPWTPDALHGGPVAALVAREVERCIGDDLLSAIRVTIELLRPVPVEPLEVRASVVRPGKKVVAVEVEILAGDVRVTWARAIFLRRLAESDPAIDAVGPGPVPGQSPDAPPLPDEGHASPPAVGGYTAFHNTGAELRFVRGEFNKRGPAKVWIRLAVPVVPGETPSPFQRTVAAADFGNGVSSVLTFDVYNFINPDLTVYVDRPAVGEWVCLDATTELGTPGLGIADSRLWDIQGPLGHSLQGLLVEPRR